MKIKKYFSNRKGLTLIELLIAIALLGAVLIIASSMLVQSLNVVEPSTRRMSSSQLAELTKRELATILRTAVEFDVITDGDVNESKVYEFKAYEPSQEDFTNFKDFVLNFSSDNKTLKLNDRVISYNATGFSLDNSKSNYFRHVFDIKIEITNEDGNVAVKSTNVRSRNIRQDSD